MVEKYKFSNDLNIKNHQYLIDQINRLESELARVTAENLVLKARLEQTETELDKCIMTNN